MRATTSNWSSAPSVTNGSLMICWCTLFGKYSFSDRSLIFHWPVPGWMRTRAMASLRRPVPSALPVTTGLRTAAFGWAVSPVAVVYSDRCSSGASASGPASSVSVDSATFSSSYFPLESCLALTLPGAGLLLDLRDLERHRLLGLVRVLWARVHLELAQHLPAEGVLGEHALDRLLHGTLGALGHQFGVRNRVQATRVATVPVGHLVPQLVPAEGDLGRVDDDDEVPGVQMRREYWLVLATQQRSRLTSEPPKYDVRCVDDVPLALDISGLRAESAHSHKPSRVSPESLARAGHISCLGAGIRRYQLQLTGR